MPTRDLKTMEALSTHEPCNSPPGLGLRQPSAAFELLGGLPKAAEGCRSPRLSKTLARRIHRPAVHGPDAGQKNVQAIHEPSVDKGELQLRSDWRVLNI